MGYRNDTILLDHRGRTGELGRLYHDVNVVHMDAEVAALRRVVEELHRGLVGLTVYGTICWATPLAMRWIEDYWPSERRSHDGLPMSLQCWVEHYAQQFRHSALAFYPPLIAQHENRQLTIQLRGHPTGYLLIFREQFEQHSVHVPEALGLTQREAEILRWVADGKTNPEIAIILGISARTVQKHLERIYQKLGVECRMAAARRLAESLENLC